MKQNNKNIVSCKTQSDEIINQSYWQKRWVKKETHWDIGHPAPALTEFLEKITDKNTKILIPGCGNAYEAEYLIEKGFTNITLIDIAPLAIENLKQKFKNNSSITILCEDFFEHKGQYDLVLEQTFLSAIPPLNRQEYSKKMHEILNKNGALVGVLFNKKFNNPFPPFGGHSSDYKTLFEPLFEIKKMEACYNSIPPRAGNEIFIKLVKK